MGLRIGNKDFAINGTFPKIIRLEAEFYEWLNDPRAVVSEMRTSNPGADLFTFVQKGLPPGSEPSYDFYRESDTIAVVTISSYDEWWNGLRHETRVKIRKALKRGVESRVVEFSDDFVAGIKKIYDESPLRQGKPFMHYRKSLEDLKREHSSFLDRSQFLGVFWEGEMIGFAKIVHGDGFSGFMNIIAMIGHRDKAPTNALMAKAVEVCAGQRIHYLQYGSWSKRGLGDFKENHAFKPVEVVRYFVPLNLRGELALRLKMHRNLSEMVPGKWVDLAVEARNRWNSARFAAFTRSREK